MKHLLYIIPILFGSLIFTFTSCEEATDILNDLTDSSLTTEEVVMGLKKALEVGTDSSTTNLSKSNGYYGDVLVKIPLPDEAETVRQQIVELSKMSGLSSVFDLDKEFEDVIKSINKAAEESAKEAKPIFVDAITGITISEGWEILKGNNPAATAKAGETFDSTAATGYFQVKTQASLKALFAPKIDVQLDKDLGLGFSANTAWTKLRNGVNGTLDYINNNLVLKGLYSAAISAKPELKINRIEETSIGNFATEKALDGLFYKVGQEEKKIRKNPYEWAIDILQKVFTWVDETI